MNEPSALPPAKSDLDDTIRALLQAPSPPHIGRLPAGPRDAITDVPGVTVGHATIDEGAVQTGVTVIRPHPGDPYRDRVPAAVAVINGFGKSCGLMQVQELGVLETPIALTNTFAVPAVAAAQIRACIESNPRCGRALPTVNALVFECNDGWLNDIQSMAVTASHYTQALAHAGAQVEQGSVGAGRGMSCFGVKGGIGTASRRVAIGETGPGSDQPERHTSQASVERTAPPRGTAADPSRDPAVRDALEEALDEIVEPVERPGRRAITVGALVLANFGRTEQGILAGHAIGGALLSAIQSKPTGRSSGPTTAIDTASDAAADSRTAATTPDGAAAVDADHGDGAERGSIIIVLATDAPLDARQLARLARRAGAGLARTGSVYGHGSGDIALAFTTAHTVPLLPEAGATEVARTLHESLLDPLFEAAADATEQAIVNALWHAQTVIGRDGHVRYGLRDLLATSAP